MISPGVTSDGIRLAPRWEGLPDAAPGDHLIERLALDAIDAPDAFGIARAHVCCQSREGATVQWIAIRVPERLDRLMLANTASRPGSAETWERQRLTSPAEGLAGVADMPMSRFLSN